MPTPSGFDSLFFFKKKIRWRIHWQEKYSLKHIELVVYLFVYLRHKNLFGLLTKFQKNFQNSKNRKLIHSPLPTTVGFFPRDSSWDCEGPGKGRGWAVAQIVFFSLFSPFCFCSILWPGIRFRDDQWIRIKLSISWFFCI